MMPAEGQRQRRSRTLYSAEFKLRVVREALARPETYRIKPTCRDQPDEEPARGRFSRASHCPHVPSTGVVASHCHLAQFTQNAAALVRSAFPSE